MMKLIKYSGPNSWEVDVSSEEEAAALLWPHICSSCRKDQIHIEEDGSELVIGEKAVEHDLDSMLASPCGCEYGVEHENDLYGLHHYRLRIEFSNHPRSEILALIQEFFGVDRVVAKNLLYLKMYNATSETIFKQLGVPVTEYNKHYPEVIQWLMNIAYYTEIELND